MIASRACGGVVEDGINGIRLAEVTGSAIAEALVRCLRTPEVLAEFSGRAIGGRLELDQLRETVARLMDT